MAYPYTSRGLQSPREEQQMPSWQTQNPLSPQRNPNTNRYSGSMLGNTTNAARGGLSRRYTTNELPTLTPIGQQRKQAAGDYLPAAYSKLSPAENAAYRYEALLKEQQRIRDELDRIDPETRREVDHGRFIEQSITQMLASSEPASPPEYSNAFSNSFSRTNRFSNSSLNSAPGFTSRPNRSSTQLTSPSAGVVRPYTSGHAHLPSQSVPGSRRQSDDEDDEETFMYGYDGAFHRAGANPNRNSMPITGYGRKPNASNRISLGPVNTNSFFLDDDDEDHRTPLGSQSTSTAASPPTAKQYLEVQHTADGFPKLIRREDNADALDLALAQGVEPQVQLADRGTASRHRISLPPSALGSGVNIAPLNSILANADGKAAAGNRRSVEVKFSAGTKRPSLNMMASPPRGAANGLMQKPSSSYSTNDIPTLKSINGDSPITSGGVPLNLPSRQSTGPIDPTSPENAISRITSTSSRANRQSQDLGSLSRAEEQENFTTSTNSGLHASAAPFGPMAPSDTPMQGFQNGFSPNGMSPYAQQQYYGNGGGYNMGMLNQSFGNMSLNGYGGQPQWPGQMGVYGTPNGYNGQQPGFGPNGNAVTGAGRYGDQQRAAMQKRQDQEVAQARFNRVEVSQLEGEIYGLCKDQHGCRFLQRKLDERGENSVTLIFTEVKDHIIELMTDPFGNYLCQKLLECTEDDQRTTLIQNASPAMTKIALNQHGTRALQKMIEYITTPEQTNLIIGALRYDVVQLIQDLNGNHVIQKCLNHLSPENAQFIFDAVGQHCVVVGTHRHGCCVLQRCIDHATGMQKGTLVQQVVNHAYELVMDPYGNYVVQYILDLGEPTFTERLCESFFGKIPQLSKQKFSSNVIEKCLRCASVESRRKITQEISNPQDLERLVRDSFANYVVQTALDFADEEKKALLVENLRPILPAIRSAPYGRRLASKIAEYDSHRGLLSSVSSGATTPGDASTLSPSAIHSAPNGMHAAPNGMPPFSMTSPQSQLPSQSVPSGGRANRQGWANGPPPQWSGFSPNANGFGGNYNQNAFDMNGMNGPNGATGMNGNGTNGEVASPTPQRHSHGNSFLANEFGSPNTFQTRQAAAYNHF